jgi:hypothetical protein
MNICIITSFLFLFNAYITMVYNQYMYMFLFLILFLTSLLYHSIQNDVTLYIDKFAILMIVLYGGNILYNKNINAVFMNYFILFMIIFTFLGTIYLFYYGYMNNMYCFHPDEMIANLYHCLLHIFASIGHYLIVIL